jgi:ferritin-like metal-binding protein YciE
MAAINTLTALLVEQLKDIYDAENRLTKAIPKLIKASTNSELRAALSSHLTETKGQIGRLDKAFRLLGEKSKGRPCAGIRGIIEEGSEHANEKYGDDGLRDATIIGSAQRAEHYEIAAYGTAIAHARLLEQRDVVHLLEETLAEEKAADQKLTDIAVGVVNMKAQDAVDGWVAPVNGSKPRAKKPARKAGGRKK